ncbi:ribosome biogenesis protein BMS1 homolog isoform X2 [Anneissia japonica]|uniref:ribosome biogenesis protein BMS1 homolog isoform X1 n=1 Tax=Anneissia japonica TaxID=1529436 RepID=UPI0014254E49|nr:ribosome biogenesis protein BMS1 homolog isoform X1 [Anneissia japonica]XP_033104644.1 ribosome biogenesis protein BMS1 homolog isoform X2 [Anneissia japonica]
MLFDLNEKSPQKALWAFHTHTVDVRFPPRAASFRSESVVLRLELELWFLLFIRKCCHIVFYYFGLGDKLDPLKTVMETTPTPKTHRERQAGPKAKKKKKKEKKQDENVTDGQRNPRAYAFHSAANMAKSFRRNMDLQSKRHHIPLVDRTPLEPPPVVVAVVGPPKVGKSTLIRCLIRNYTRQNLVTVQGPVTIVSGKKRRLTFIECNNDMNSMIDLAKIADLVLLLVDASFGFEMEVFEFLNIVQIHGFPKIMGVLTHLDQLKNNKTLKKTKKRLKNRFWTEIYQGAKLFYLSGMVYSDYQQREIHNLGRFISVMKFRPLVWRSTHPYILADRMEDLTDPEEVRQDPKCDRTVSFYGYVRGTPLKSGSNIHIAGCGDFHLKDVSYLADPCPLPDKEKKRSLNQKERLIYAPQSGVGGIVYDKDVVYIDLGNKAPHSQVQQDEERPSNEMVSNLIGTQQTIDAKMALSKLAYFPQSTPIASEAVPKDQPVRMPEEELVYTGGRVRRRAVFGDVGEAGEDSGNETEDDEEESGSDLENDSADDLEREEDKSNQLDALTPSTKKSKRPKVDMEELIFADSAEEDLDGNNAVNLRQSQRNQKKREDDENPGLPEDSDEDGSEESDMEQQLEKEKNKRKRKLDKEISERTVSGGKVKKTTRKSELKKSIKEKSLERKLPKKYKMQEVHVSRKDVDEDSAHKDTEEKDEDSDDKDIEEEIMGDEEEEDESCISDSDGAEFGNNHLRWKDGMVQRAADAFVQRQKDTPNLRKLVYGLDENELESDEEEELGGLFKISGKSNEKKQKQGNNDKDSSAFPLEVLRDWTTDEMKELIVDCFVTGKWSNDEDAKTLLDQDDDLYGDFEDLETGFMHKGKTTDTKDDEDDDRGSESDGDSDEEEKDDNQEIQKKDMTKKEKFLEKKRKLKEVFDAAYDNADGGSTYYDDLKQQMNQQAELNRKEFEDMDDDVRTQYEGFRPGMYVRLEVANMPFEFVKNFDPEYPMVIGGLLSSEENIGYVQMRIKKHRWYSKILKTRDPLIFSLGWRRFQTIPLFSIEDHNGRRRLLKYTPEHMHCMATIWGPITPQGTGFLAVQTVAGRMAGFRIAATGAVTDLDKSLHIVKKLKLIGTPIKIHKNTAFIKGMFNTVLEVARFEGATIKTVSGIRGQIKKAIKTPEGAFRASFEDKILKSDIVFLRGWIPVFMPKFYNPMQTLLLPKGEKDNWTGMRTVGQLRMDNSIPVPVNKDSLYKPIERKPKVFRELRVPRGLQKALPFKDKPKEKLNRNRKTIGKMRAVVREPEERRAAALVHQMSTLYNERKRQERNRMVARVELHKKKMSLLEEKKDERQKKAKREIYRMLGKMKKKGN